MTLMNLTWEVHHDLYELKWCIMTLMNLTWEVHHDFHKLDLNGALWPLLTKLEGFIMICMNLSGASQPL